MNIFRFVKNSLRFCNRMVFRSGTNYGHYNLPLRMQINTVQQICRSIIFKIVVYSMHLSVVKWINNNHDSYLTYGRPNITIYNIAFVNSEPRLAKSRVDITQCQHGNVGKFLSLCFFVLYYKTNIKHFFCIDIQFHYIHMVWI